MQSDKQMPYRDEYKYKIPWKTGLTYESLCGKYTEYVKKKYDQLEFCLLATKVVLVQRTILIWGGVGVGVGGVGVGVGGVGWGWGWGGGGWVGGGGGWI